MTRKKSLPVLYGLEHNPEFRELYARPHQDKAELQKAVSLLDSLDAKSVSVNYEVQYFNKATDALKKLDNASPASKAMHQLVAFLFQRTV